MAIPFMIFACVMGGSVLFQLFKRFRGVNGQFEPPFSWGRFLKDRCIALLILFVVAMYAFLVSSALGPFKCVGVGNGVFIMYDNPSANCFDSDWNGMLGTIIFFVVLYGFILPSIMVYFFWINRHNVTSEEFRYSFASITSAYKDKYFWWELVAASKRTTFVIINAFLSTLGSEDINLFGSTLLLFLYLIIDVAFKPFKMHAWLLTSVS
jgi:hypothetical protein